MPDSVRSQTAAEGFNRVTVLEAYLKLLSRRQEQSVVEILQALFLRVSKDV